MNDAPINELSRAAPSIETGVHFAMGPTAPSREKAVAAEDVEPGYSFMK
jgi:hypothetical protein